MRTVMLMPNCMSFRELRRQTRLVRLKRKGAALGVDSESLASFSHINSCEFGDAIAFVEPSKGSREREAFDFFVNTLVSLALREIDNMEKLTGEELEGIDLALAMLRSSVDQLRGWAPFGDEGDYFSKLEWALRSAHHIGTACEEIPKQWIGPGKSSRLSRLQTEEGRKKLLELRPRQQRLEIMEPLIYAALDATDLKSKKAPSIAKYIRPALEKELKARGMPAVKPDTIRTDVEYILKRSGCLTDIHIFLEDV
jgi:hypothetical protein